VNLEADRRHVEVRGQIHLDDSVFAGPRIEALVIGEVLLRPFASSGIGSARDSGGDGDEGGGNVASLTTPSLRASCGQ
jgi:hypothetical protein